MNDSSIGENATACRGIGENGTCCRSVAENVRICRVADTPAETLALTGVERDELAFLATG